MRADSNARGRGAAGAKEHVEASDEHTTRRGRVLAALEALFAHEDRRALERRIGPRFDARLSAKLDRAIAGEESCS